MAPVIVPYDAKAKELLKKLKAGFLPPGAAARALQNAIRHAAPVQIKKLSSPR
jgi:hypothetical protein